MNIGLKIKELASKENLEISAIAEKLGKSKQAVYDMLSKQDLNTSVLRELSVILKVPITAFFQENDDLNPDNSIQEKLVYYSRFSLLCIIKVNQSIKK